MSDLFPHLKFGAAALALVIVLSMLTRAATGSGGSITAASPGRADDLVPKIQLYMSAAVESSDDLTALSHANFAMAYLKLLPAGEATAGNRSVRDLQTEVEAVHAQVLKRLRPGEAHGRRAPYG